MYDTLHRPQDVAFEMEMGITVQPPSPKELFNFDSQYILQHATAMGAINLRNLDELFQQTRYTNCEYEFFFDIGSGCGKACFYAAYNKIAKLIVGIEYVPSIYNRACANLKHAGFKNVEFRCANALDIALPNSPSIVFMFNPFDALLLETFFSQNINHFRDNKSIIVYANDCHRGSLAILGYEAIFRSQVSCNSIYQAAKSRSFSY